MDFKGEARARLEAERRAAESLQQQKRAQEEARQRADQQRRQSLSIQQSRFRGEALAKFKALRPEEIIRDLRRAWGTGQIVDYSSYGGVGVYHRNDSFGDGIMLYQRSDTAEHFRHRHEAHYSSNAGTMSVDLEGLSEGRSPGYDEDIESYKVDYASIDLFEEFDRKAGHNRFKVSAADKYGVYRLVYHKIHGWFTKREEYYSSRHHTMSDVFPHPYAYGLWDLDRVTQGDIRSFFVATTAGRMQGEGNIRIN